MNNLRKHRVFKNSNFRETNPTRAAEVPIIVALETDLLAVAIQSLESSRQAVERLIGSIPLDNHFAMGILGPILAEIRTAQAIIDRLTAQIA